MSDAHRPPSRTPSRQATRVAALRSPPSRAAEIATGVAGAVLAVAAAVTAALLLIASTARAESFDAERVLAELEARLERLQDISFVLEGELLDEAGQRIAVEIEVLAIPSLPAASLYIIQPDALADNMIVLADDEIRNYTFLTNQVAVYDADDPQAFGGLFPEGEAFVLDLDLGSVFAGWDASVDEVEAGPQGERYTLRFTNLDPGANVRAAIAVIDASDWLPLRLVFYASGDERFADVRLVMVEVDTGLDVAEVTWLPDDAEVLDRRR